jgi:hypothetical protein
MIRRKKEKYSDAARGEGALDPPAVWPSSSLCGFCRFVLLLRLLLLDFAAIFAAI